MDKTIVGFLVALSLGLAGCATPMAPPIGEVKKQKLKPLKQVGKEKPKERYTAGWCSDPVCNFEVTVDKDCNIDVDPQVMGIVRNNKKVTLQWTLSAPAGFTFANDADGAIPFKPGTPPGSEFGNESVTATIVTRLNENSRPGTYHYTIRVMENGAVCGELDPPVINEM
jgi:hypothetical protein